MTPLTSKDAILRPPFDPALEKARSALTGNLFASVKEIRGKGDTFTAATFLVKFPDMEHVEDNIPAPKENPGGTITLPVFKSKTSTSTSRPASYNIHGGGHIAGNRFAGIEWLAKWYEGIDIVHICVAYRPAPEHPAPAALQDCYAGLVWVADHAAELGIDPMRIPVQESLKGTGKKDSSQFSVWLKKLKQVYCIVGNSAEVPLCHIACRLIRCSCEKIIIVLAPHL